MSGWEVPPGNGQSSMYPVAQTSVESSKQVEDPGSLFARWDQQRRMDRVVDPLTLQANETDRAKMLPPWAWKPYPATSLCAKFVHLSVNKAKQPVLCVAWTPEGRRLVTGAQSGEFTLWNGTNFQFEMLMQAHENAVRAMRYSNRGEWLISGDVDGVVKVWQPNFNNVNIVQAHREVVKGLAWSPSDAKFATCSDDGTVKVWSFTSMTEELVLKSHLWDVNSVDWHPSMGLLASGSKDNTVKLWDPRAGGRVVETLLGSKNTIWRTRFQPTGGQWLLAASSRDQAVQMYDLRMLSKHALTLRGEPSDVTALAWHPVHSELLTTGNQDGSVSHFLLDNPPGDRGLSPALTIRRAHYAPVWDASYHPAGHMLCTGSHDRSVRFWVRPQPGDSKDVVYDPRFYTVQNRKGDQQLDPAALEAAEGAAKFRQMLQDRERQRLDSGVIPGLDLEPEPEPEPEQPELGSELPEEVLA